MSARALFTAELEGVNEGRGRREGTSHDSMCDPSGGEFVAYFEECDGTHVVKGEGAGGFGYGEEVAMFEGIRESFEKEAYAYYVVERLKDRGGLWVTITYRHCEGPGAVFLAESRTYSKNSSRVGGCMTSA